MSRLIVPNAPRAVHPAFARLVHECVRDTILSHCPDMRALAISTPMLARMHVLQSMARREIDTGAKVSRIRL